MGDLGGLKDDLEKAEASSFSLRGPVFEQWQKLTAEIQERPDGKELSKLLSERLRNVTKKSTAKKVMRRFAREFGIATAAGPDDEVEVPPGKTPRPNGPAPSGAPRLETGPNLERAEKDLNRFYDQMEETRVQLDSLASRLRGRSAGLSGEVQALKQRFNSLLDEDKEYFVRKEDRWHAKGSPARLFSAVTAFKAEVAALRERMPASTADSSPGRRAVDVEKRAALEIEDRKTAPGEKVSGEFLDSLKAEAARVAEAIRKLPEYAQRVTAYLRSQGKTETAVDAIAMAGVYLESLRTHQTKCLEVKRDDGMAEATRKVKATRGVMSESRGNFNELLRRHDVPAFNAVLDQSAPWPGEKPGPTETSVAAAENTPKTPPTAPKPETKPPAAPEHLSAESKKIAEALLTDPKKELKDLSDAFTAILKSEVHALRSNPAAYAEYEADLKRKMDQLKPEVVQGIEGLASVPRAERSRDTAIALGAKLFQLYDKHLAAAVGFLQNANRFPDLQRERSLEDHASLEKRNEYIAKANALRGRNLKRLGPSVWSRLKKDKLKARFWDDAASPQKVIDEVTRTNPLLKPGESLAGLHAEDRNARRESFLKALRAKGLEIEDATAVYEAALAKAEYQASLVALGNSMMDSERTQIRQAMEKILGLPFEQWPADKKAELENQLAVYKSSGVVDRVVFQEQQELAKANAESLPPEKKALYKQALDWYLRQKPAKKLGLSIAFGFGITALGGVFGIGAMAGMAAGFGAGAKSYLTTRLIGMAAGMPAMRYTGKLHDFVVGKLGFLEKAKQKEKEKIETLRKNFSPENLAALQASLSEAMEARAQTERILLLTKVALTGAVGFLAARGASKAYLEFANSSHAAAAAAGFKDLKDRVFDNAPGAPKPVTGFPPEAAGAGGRDLIVEVHKGDSLWKILRHQGYSDGKIAQLVQEAKNPEMMRAMGIRGNVDLIYTGQRLNLGPLLEHSSVPGVADHFPTDHGAAFELGKDGVYHVDAVGARSGHHALDAVHGGHNGAEHLSDHGGGFYESPGPRVSVKSMTLLWEMQNPGQHPSDSLLRQWAEMGAHGDLLKNTEMFDYEIRFRMHDQIKGIFGPRGLDDTDWLNWKDVSAENAITMPNSQAGGEQGAALRDYMQWLDGHPNVEPPFHNIGGKPETVEHFIARAESQILVDQLNAGGQGTPMPRNFEWTNANDAQISPEQPPQAAAPTPGWRYDESGRLVSTEHPPQPLPDEASLSNGREGWYQRYDGTWVSTEHPPQPPYYGGYGRDYGHYGQRLPLPRPPEVIERIHSDIEDLHRRHLDIGKQIGRNIRRRLPGL